MEILDPPLVKKRSGGCYEDKKPSSMPLIGPDAMIQESSLMEEDFGKFWTTTR